MNWNTVVFANGRILKWRVWDTARELFAVQLNDANWELVAQRYMSIETDYLTAHQFAKIMQVISELNPAENIWDC